MEKFYSMKEVSEITGLTYDTLKYYSNEGLIPDVKKDKNNYRIFDEKNIGWIKSLSYLKKFGMSNKEIKVYMKLCKKGISSIPERKEILNKILNELEKEIDRIRESIDYINFKKQFYDDVISGKKEYFSYLVR